MKAEYEPETLSEDQARELIDRLARRYVGISGPEFVRRWNAGEFDRPERDPRLMRVAMLLPLVR